MKRFLPLLLLALLPSIARADRAFIIDAVAVKASPSEIDWPAGPAGLTGRFEGAIIVAPVPGQPTLFVFDVIARPGVLAYVQSHIAATRWLGQKYSDLRALTATRPLLVAAIFRKVVSRVVTINALPVTVQMVVPQSDATVGDIVVQAETPPNRFFGVNDGED